MSRFTQQWHCRACGHVKQISVSYPKHGADNTPLTVIARRARCTRCGVRGRCAISEWARGTPPPAEAVSPEKMLG